MNQHVKAEASLETLDEKALREWLESYAIRFKARKLDQDERAERSAVDNTTQQV